MFENGGPGLLLKVFIVELQKKPKNKTQVNTKVCP